MDDRDIILHCVSEVWPDDVTMISDDLFEGIVDDALSGVRADTSLGRGGYNSDLVLNINTIIEAALLVVELLVLLRSMRSKKDEAELITIIIKMKNIGHEKARDLARLLLNIRNGEQ